MPRTSYPDWQERKAATLRRSAHKAMLVSRAVLRAKAEQRAIWRDPVLAAQALAELAATRKPRRGRPPKAAKVR